MDVPLEQKLGKSLDVLIKESTRGGPRRGGFRHGRGGSRGRGRRGSMSRVDPGGDVEMDTGEPERSSNPLKARGGVGKSKGFQRQSRYERDRAGAPPGNPNDRWQHDLHRDDGPARPRVAPRGGARGGRTSLSTSGSSARRFVYISNLDLNVSEEDMRELFSFVQVNTRSVHMDLTPAHDSQTCLAEFASNEEAVTVRDRYDGQELDNRAMKIVIRGASRPTTLQSGIRLTSRSGAGGARSRGFRGKGRLGLMRSDAMDQG